MAEDRDRGGRKAALRWCAPPFLAAALVVLAFDAVGDVFVGSFKLDLGSLTLPAPLETYFFLHFAIFGGLAAALLGVALARILSLDTMRPFLDREPSRRSDRLWIIGGTTAGIVIPLGISLLVLGGAPLTDDESSYRFMGELVATGRLRVPSPPMKLFHDREFMINDGHMYAQYFVGWPALMAPGIWLGIPDFMNALYSGLTMPAVFLVARRLVGPRLARLAVILALSSPMLMIVAATEMSHTTCLMALAWMTWFTLRCSDARSPAWAHLGVAAAFGVAFFIRPSSAAGVGLPFLVAWAAGLKAKPLREQITAIAAFATAALVLGALFFLVNKVQTGAYTTVAYLRQVEYARENGYQFTLWAGKKDYLAQTPVPHLDPFRPFVKHVALTGVALLRFNFAFLGWPASLPFIAFEGGSRHARVVAASFICYCLVHLTVLDPGVDTFGPHHYVELAWPALLLTVLGLQRLGARLGQMAPPTETASASRRLRLDVLPAALAIAMVALSLGRYMPIRVQALASIAERVNAPVRAVAAAHLRSAIVFTPRPFVPRCRGPRHWVFARPTNDPDLRNDILWVNDLGLEENRRLMTIFPDRAGYVLDWTPQCEARLTPLAGPAPPA